MPTHLHRALLLIVVSCVFPRLAFAIVAGDDRKSIVISRTALPPVIDGRIEIGEWAGATLVNDFHQVRPNDGDTPSESTTVHISYDNDFSCC